MLKIIDLHRLFIAVAVLFSMAYAAEAKPNKVADNIYWEVSGDTLRVFGQGAIPDFDMEKSRQWRNPKVWHNINVIEVGEGITSIGEHAFSNYFGWEKSDKLKVRNTPVDLYLPLSLREIKFMSFNDLGIKTLILPSRLEVIGWSAFSTDSVADSEDWGTITIPASVQDIGNRAFEKRHVRQMNIEGAPDIDISAITTIPTLEGIDFNNMPSRLHGLASMNPQPTLTRIKNWKNVKGMPYDFKKIAEDKREPVVITWDDGIRYRIDFKKEEATYLGPDNIDELYYISGYVMIPDEITYQGETFAVTGIRKGLFTGDTRLTDITLPDAMTVIPAEAFRNCINLKHVDLPQNLVRVGDFAFDGCKSLEYVTFPESTRVIGNAAFDGCLSLESVILPDGLKKIGDHCFDVCPKLTHITVPDGVELGHDWYRSSPSGW